ncbi:MAG: aminotransferase class IV [Bacteroidota bacterium]
MLILNGQLVEETSPEASVLNRGFKYGDALFETIRVYHKQIPLLSYHLDRLIKGLYIMKYEFHEGDFRRQMKQELYRALEVNGIVEHGKIRLQVYRAGEGTYTPLQRKPQYVIETYPLRNDPFKASKPITLGSYQEYELGLHPLSGIKTVNATVYILAGMHAMESGVDECLVYQQGKVAETHISNIFLVKQKKLITPPLETGCLDGVMRRKLIEVCQTLSVPVEERLFKESMVKQADEVFVTNSVKGIVPVDEFQNIRWDISRCTMIPFLRRCLEQYLISG